MEQNVHRVSVEIGGTEIEFETGKLARQASGAVLVKAGDTMSSPQPPREMTATWTSSR